MAGLQFLFATYLVLTFVSCNACKVHGQDVGHGQMCSLINNCRSDFICVSERCECPYPRFQNYDYTIDRCVSNVFGPCTRIVDGETVDIPCVTNAECRNDNGFPECMCKPGTRQSGRTCRAEFGQPCKMSSDCFNPTPFSDNPLVCQNERCDCRNLNAFDEATGNCVGLVGAFCGTLQTCVEGAACERFDSIDGLCRCTGAFTPTPDRRCTLLQCPKL